MKTIIIFGISLLIFSNSFAQDKNYRVMQIQQIKINALNNTIDTIIQSYTYKDSLLSKVQFIKKNQVENFHTYLYTNNQITVQDKNNRMVRSYKFNEVNEIEEYWNDNCDKFTFSYADNRIKGIERMDKCDQYNEGNDFEYLGDRLSKVKTYVKTYVKKHPNYSTDYVFTYENDTLKKIVWGSNIDVYIINWRNSLIESILHSKFEKNDWRKEYIYDNHSKIIEERYYAISNDKESLSEKHIITYSNSLGNDDIVWGLYDWKINIFLNQRTYKNFVQRRY